MKKSFLLFALPIIILSCNSSSESKDNKANTTDKPQKRIVAIGDLHGDIEATRKALKLAGAIDNKDNWIAKDLILVQTGDQIDRGDYDKEVLDLFEKLTNQAEASGNKLYSLNGNHEIMNASGDMRYVTDKSFQSFKIPEIDISNPILNKIPEDKKYRYASFLPGNLYAKKLSKRETILVIGDNVFVHGGLLPKHVEYGIAKINQEVKDWLKSTKLVNPPTILTEEDGVIWNRQYADEKVESDCETLKKTLAMIPAKRMIIGHTVHSEGISSDCDNSIWRIDTGMSKFYQGQVQVLEIKADKLQVLK